MPAPAAATINMNVGQHPCGSTSGVCPCWPVCVWLQCLVLAAKDDAQRKEQLVLINTRLLALCTAFDSVAADTDKLEAAAEVYRDLLSSVSGQQLGLVVRGEGGAGLCFACPGGTERCAAAGVPCSHGDSRCTLVSVACVQPAGHHAGSTAPLRGLGLLGT